MSKIDIRAIINEEIFIFSYEFYGYLNTKYTLGIHQTFCLH